MKWNYVPLRNSTQWMKRAGPLLSDDHSIHYEPKNTGICDKELFVDSNPSWKEKIWYKKFEDDKFLQELSLARLTLNLETKDVAELPKPPEGQHLHTSK